MNEKFIFVTDKDVANHLISLSYRLIQNNPDKALYVFENKPSLKFDLNGKSNFVLSNKLFF